MKTETLRRVCNIKKLLKRGADVWETGNFRILWFEDPTPTPESKGMIVYHCKKRVFGHLRLIS
jgi:hypothetical protein